MRIVSFQETFTLSSILFINEEISICIKEIIIPTFLFKIILFSANTHTFIYQYPLLFSINVSTLFLPNAEPFSCNKYIHLHTFITCMICAVCVTILYIHSLIHKLSLTVIPSHYYYNTYFNSCAFVSHS